MRERAVTTRERAHGDKSERVRVREMTMMRERPVIARECVCGDDSDESGDERGDQ